jgi:hypothetical protein
MVPCMLVHSWPLSTEMWDGEVLAVIKRLNICYLILLSCLLFTVYKNVVIFTQGPIPTLFSEDPTSTMEAIKKETAKLHWDLSKLYKVGIHTMLYILN